MKKGFLVSALVIAIVTIASVNVDAQCARGGGYRHTRSYYVPRPVVVVQSGYGYGGYNNRYYRGDNCRPRYQGGRNHRSHYSDNRNYNGYNNNGYNNNGYNNNGYNNNNYNQGGNYSQNGHGRRR